VADTLSETDTISLTPSGMVAVFYSDKLGRMPTVDEAFAALEEELAEIDAELFPWSIGDEPKEIDDPSLLKEMCDVVYTILGYCLARGCDFDGAFRAVHAANMGKPKVTSGKIPKGDGYVPPDMAPYLG
jgi:hypothetical protein